MAGLIIETQPTQEPISLAEAKNWLRVSITDDDLLIGVLITAAREACESFCNRSFAVKDYIQTLDSFPYYTDTVQSQAAYPPSYYALPMYSTTLWNYSQMIKLYAPPLISVNRIEITQADGTIANLSPSTDFIQDSINEPARIFPPFGSMWPPVLYVPNAVRIHFTAGYGSAPGQQTLPSRAKMAMLMLLANWYENREAAVATNFTEIPNHVQMLLWSVRVMDMQPTRG